MASPSKPKRKPKKANDRLCPACGKPMGVHLEVFTVRGRNCGPDYAKVSAIFSCSDCGRCGYRDRTTVESQDQDTIAELEDLVEMFHGANVHSYGKWQDVSGRGKHGRKITVYSENYVRAEAEIKPMVKR